MTRSLSSTLAKVAGQKKKYSKINPVVFFLLKVMSARGLAHPLSTPIYLYALRGLYSFAELLPQCLHVVHFVSCACYLQSAIVSTTLSAQGVAHSGAEKKSISK